MDCKKVFFLILIFALSIKGLAQNNTSKISLKSILKSIQKEHHVTFNYLENDINKITLFAPKKGLTLIEKINYLKKKTNLSFDIIDSKFISISSKKSNAKIDFCGYVYKQNTQIPIENVSVYKNNKLIGTTNALGYFSINEVENSELNFSLIGYASINYTISASKKCVSIYLQEEETTLDVVIINDYLTYGLSKKFDGSYSIQPKKLGALPGLIEPDVLQTMQQIPGIYSTDESVSSINVRGGTHDQNLFLWNGIKMYQTGHFFGLISTINPYLTNDVKVFKNGSSAFYGESVSSVVDISTNNELSNKNSYSFGLNMISMDGYSKQNISKNGFVEISARKSITDWIETPTYKQYHNKAFQNTTIYNFGNNEIINYSTDEDFNFYDVTLKYFQKIDKKSDLAFDFITIKDHLKVSQKNIDYNSDFSNNSSIYQNNLGLNLSYNRNWNKLSSSKLNISNSQYELDAQNNNELTNESMIQENKVNDFSVKLENHNVINSKFKIGTGYQYNNLKINCLDITNSASDNDSELQNLKSHALIVDGKYSDSQSRLIVTSGLRINYIENFKKLLFEPRLQFNYKLSDYFFINVLGEFKSQNIFQIIEFQDDYFGIEKRRWMLANDNSIPTQKSKQVSLNLSFKENNWFLSAETFYKNVTGITTEQQDFNNQYSNMDAIGDYKVNGYEFLIQKKLNNFLAWISYTINDSNYNFPTLKHSSFSNNFGLNKLISFAGVYEKNNFKIALGAKWHTGKPYTGLQNDMANSTLEFSAPNNDNLEKFFQVNGSMSYLLKKNKVNYQFGFSVLNILNAKSEISESYRFNTTNNIVEEIKAFSLKRTINASFRISF